MMAPRGKQPAASTPALAPGSNNPSSAETWRALEQGVEQIMMKLKDGMDMKTYMNLYTSVHNFCTSQRGITQPATVGLNNAQRGAHLLGEELYTHLTEYLRSHLNGVLTGAAGLSGEPLLTYYIKQWKRYTTAAGYNNHVFKYLNRHWVKREVEEGKKNVYDIYTLHLVRWRDDLFSQVQMSVMEAVLNLAERERDGETIDHSQIKNIVESFSQLGIDEADFSKGTLDIYKQHFEKPYIEATRKYYTTESQQFLADNSVVEYMKKAEIRIAEEQERVRLYLRPEIEAPLLKACTETLIADHSQLLRDEFQRLLDQDRIEDLGRMYKLLQRVPDGLDPLRARFEKHVTNIGQEAVAKVVAATGDKDLDPKDYVDALLSVHTKYNDLVTRAFGGESEFIRNLDSSCRQYVNHNQICEKATNRSAELLAKRVDNLLKSQAKTAEDDDLEVLLKQIMTIFKYIDDKDVFQKFYSRMLAKRLVGGTQTSSDDAETNMISKLKEACGFEYTNKLQRMFQDMQTSKDLNSAFKDWQNTQLDVDSKTAVDATYNILGTGFWPLTAPTTPFTPPRDILKCVELFQVFYASKHSGRKLQWLWQLCKGEIRANYIKLNKVPYTFQVTTYGMAVLLLFNEFTTDLIPYEEMQAQTSLGKETLDPTISMFVKAKVILPEPAEGKPESGTSYRLNNNFKHKRTKINLQMNIKSETKQEAEDTHKTIEEDRKLLIQSAIVRIMKSRKKMRHQLLLQETIAQISQRFKPSVQDIKKCIDILLEKEYLERLEGDELGYLA